MNKLFKKMNGRFAAVLVVLVTASLLSACGGGTTVDEATTPSQKAVMPALFEQAMQTTGTATDNKELLTFPKVAQKQAVAKNKLTADQFMNWAAFAFGQFFPNMSATNAPTGAGFVYRCSATTSNCIAVTDGRDVYILGPMTGNALTRVINLADLDSVLFDSNGCVAPQTWDTSLKTCALTYWPPTFVPMGVKVYLDAKNVPAGTTNFIVSGTFPGQTQSGLLPPECRSEGDACWKQAVANGTVQCITTTATDQTGRPTVFCVYRIISVFIYPGQNRMFWCNKPFYADTGRPPNPGEHLESFCDDWEEVFHVGNSLGEIFQSKNPTTGVMTYYQQKFRPDLGGWAASETTYP
jgi:hypothetical protein